MAKITLTFDVPDDVAEQLKELEARLKRLESDKIGVEAAIPEDDIDVRHVGHRARFEAEVASRTRHRRRKAAAFLMQLGTSREAEAAARELGILPYSRSSFERVGHDVGERYSVVRYDVEEELIRGYAVPREARSVSASLDRVAVPFEEPRKRRAADVPTVSRSVRSTVCGTWSTSPR